MAPSQARAAATYKEVQVASRSPLELVVMLYDGALGALRQAAEAMRRHDLPAKRDAMRKGLQIVQHLQSTLNMEEGGEVASQLDTMYAVVISRIVDANVKSDPAPLDEAIQAMSSVRDAWAQIATAPLADSPTGSSTPSALGR